MLVEVTSTREPKAVRVSSSTAAAKACPHELGMPFSFSPLYTLRLSVGGKEFFRVSYILLGLAYWMMNSVDMKS